MSKGIVCLSATVLIAAAVLVAGGAAQSVSSFVSSDLHSFRQVGEVHFSPDGKSIAYTVISNDQPGRPYSQLFVMDITTRMSRRIGGSNDTASSIHWSPDGSRLAYFGSTGGNSGLVVIRADGSDAAVLAPVQGTNHNLPASEGVGSGLEYFMFCRLHDVLENINGQNEILPPDIKCAAS